MVKTRRLRKIKKGGNCTYSNPSWPPKLGCNEDEYPITINIGKIFDRYGSDFGFYLGNGTSTLDERSLPIIRPEQECKKEYYRKINTRELVYNKFKVLKPFKALTCSIAPFFDHNGGGVQFRLYPDSITSNDRNKKKNGNVIFKVKDNPQFPAPIPSEILTPNVNEMIQLGYLEKISTGINVPTFDSNDTYQLTL